MGANEGEGEMSIASIDGGDGYYDENGLYQNKSYKPNPDDYKVKDSSLAKYILEADYGAKGCYFQYTGRTMFRLC